jgi:acetylornithine deacetylase/succinyl-diaminopimelate desuccinylase-like protein
MEFMIDWEKETAETIQNLSGLLQLDTTNPPGNELPAILLIKEIFERNGFPEESIQLLDVGQNRGNIVVRLKGDGTSRPLLLTGHVDVVPVEREYWSRDPFGGEEVEGCIWGRGALDMKGTVAMYLQMMLIAQRANLPLKRDLIFAAISDEETTFEHGSRYLVENHPDLIDAEYALCEEGGKTVYQFGLRVYQIKVAEKGVCWLRATAEGDPGHGSMPHGNNSVYHLVEKLEKLRVKKYLPFHFSPFARKTLQRLASNVSFPQNFFLHLLQYPFLTQMVLERLPEEERREILPIISNTISPTVLKAGSKTNVIPSESIAHIDCRMLPGFKPEEAMQEIRDIAGEDFKLETLDTSIGPQVPTDTHLYELLEESILNMDPEGVIIPYLSPGASDAVEYSKAGIKVYGFAPGIIPEGFPYPDLVHSHDERIPVGTIHTGLPALWHVVSNFCCS